MSRDLDAWLDYVEQLHPRVMEPGLERVRAVAHELELLPYPLPVITVAGTNGKGSCLALMEELAGARGRRAGLFTSPHLFRFNERIRVAGVEATDDTIAEALEAIDRARGGISLTYFEFAALAALRVFVRQGADLALLEVGLGGRLDAVNIVDPDVAVITSVGLDHMDWLGPDRETIALEKMGIARVDTPLVYGETDLPASIAERSEREGIPLWRAGLAFGVDGDSLYWQGSRGPARAEVADIPLGRDNLATAVQALALLHIEPDASALARAAALRLPGRGQCLEHAGVTWYLDVGHNEEALTRFRRALPPARGQTRAVAALKMDKPARRALAGFVDVVDDWYLAGLPGYRGSGPEQVRAALPESVTASEFAGVSEAVEAARAAARPGDQVLVLGSFITVAAALQVLREQS